MASHDDVETCDVRGGAPDPAPRIGVLFAGRYRIDALIGEGGFGAVYAAHDRSLDRVVAIKVLNDRGDATVLARFLQEAKAIAALDSEHVVVVHEVATAEAVPYLVMERLRGSDLQGVIAERGRLPVGEAIDLVLQAALGIAHAHARGIVHRDIKPRNLFLAERRDGTRVVKVLDFGVARSSASELTETGATLGTTKYMAPEQLRSSRSVDARTDLWALGVVLYELVTGAAIFDATSGAEFGVAILSDRPVPLRARVPDLPADLERVVDRCLAKEPAQRYPDVAAFARALGADAGMIARIESALHGGAAGFAATAGKTSPRAPHAPSRWFAIAALAVGIAGFGFGIAMWLRSPVISTALPDASASAAVSVADAMQLAVLADAASIDATQVAVVVDAAPLVTPVRPARPTVSDVEVQRIFQACTDDKPTSPMFLIPNSGGGDYTCRQIALLGCPKVIARCASEPITTDEKLLCRSFVARLRRKAVCT